MPLALDRQALLIAAVVWALHATIEMLITGAFLTVALIWAAHGLVLMVFMGTLVVHALRWTSRPARWAACVTLALGFAATQTAIDLWVTLNFGRSLSMLSPPPGMTFSSSSMEFRVAFALNYKYYIWLFGFFAAFLALLASARQKWETQSAADRAQLAADRAEIEALRLRINPHFLFNVFSTLDALLRKKRVDDAERMLGRLSGFYRTALLEEHDATIPLIEELAILDDYVAVEAVRFGSRLTLAVDIDSDLESFPVPPLLLQPLVENAIKYGNDGASALEVRLSARRHIDMVVIDLANRIAEHSVPGGAGVALATVRRRIRAVYGPAAAIEFVGDRNVWTTRLRIPLDIGAELQPEQPIEAKGRARV